MDRVIVARPWVGLFMEVCAEKDATDQEILRLCNQRNPSGTTHGWMKVIRNGSYRAKPIVCPEDPNRMHFIVAC